MQFAIYQDNGGHFHWRLVDGDGTRLAVSAADFDSADDARGALSSADGSPFTRTADAGATRPSDGRPRLSRPPAAHRSPRGGDPRRARAPGPRPQAGPPPNDPAREHASRRRPGRADRPQGLVSRSSPPTSFTRSFRSRSLRRRNRARGAPPTVNARSSTRTTGYDSLKAIAAASPRVRARRPGTPGRRWNPKRLGRSPAWWYRAPRRLHDPWQPADQRMPRGSRRVSGHRLHPVLRLIAAPQCLRSRGHPRVAAALRASPCWPPE
jgi:uncharacterized protein YegP (UPF0339 family)